MSKRWLTKRFLVIAAITAVILIAVVVLLDTTAPRNTFHSLAVAGKIQGIEIVGFDSGGGKDTSYFWHLRHPPEVVPRMIATLPFHPCDGSDSAWIADMFAKFFKIERTNFNNYTGYRGDNAKGDAQYILVSPNNRESFYLYIDF